MRSLIAAALELGWSRGPMRPLFNVTSDRDYADAFVVSTENTLS